MSLIERGSVLFMIFAAVCACNVSEVDEADPGGFAPEGGSTTQPTASDVRELLSYTDPRFYFSFDFPSSWNLHERADRPGAISEVLTIEAPDPAGALKLKIHIGHFLQEIAPEESLETWERRIPQAFSAVDRRITAEHPITLRRSRGVEARYTRGRSPLTEFQYVTIRHGNLNWFIWANWGDSAEVLYQGIFDIISNSFQIDAATPRTLREVTASIDVAVEPLQGESTSAALTTSWWSPVLGNTATPQWPVTCGSIAHTAGAKYAADISAPSGYQVLATRVGNVEIGGWDTSGYGNLVKLGPNDGAGRRHLYGHLQGIFLPVQTLGYRVAQGGLVGWVGNTGNASEVHLHFHIQSALYQSASTGINLIGMLGFADNPFDSHYPSSDGMNHLDCASMGR